MAQHISFVLFDSAGDPLEDQTPDVVIYRKIDGTDVLPHPTVVEKGDGFYEFTMDPVADGPVAYVIDCGDDSAVQYMVGSVGELVAFAMYDAAGDLDPTRVPAFISYTDGTLDLTPPTIVNLSGGLFGFWPDPVPGKLVQYVVGDTDNKYAGTFGNVSLSNPVPAADSEITNTQVITLDVLDTENFLGRVLIAIQYMSLGGATELVWDGSAVVGPHQVTVVPIPDGRRYSVLRDGGWPAAPTVRVFLTNFGGREI